jgi:hypothetical protein
MDKLDKVNVSPLVIALDAVSAAENKKFPAPAVTLSQVATCVSVSEPDAHDAHDGVFEIAFAPADAAAQV